MQWQPIALNSDNAGCRLDETSVCLREWASPHDDDGRRSQLAVGGRTRAGRSARWLAGVQTSDSRACASRSSSRGTRRTAWQACEGWHRTERQGAHAGGGPRRLLGETARGDSARVRVAAAGTSAWVLPDAFRLSVRDWRPRTWSKRPFELDGEALLTSRGCGWHRRSRSAFGRPVYGCKRSQRSESVRRAFLTFRTGGDRPCERGRSRVPANRWYPAISAFAVVPERSAGDDNYHPHVEKPCPQPAK